MTARPWPVRQRSFDGIRLESFSVILTDRCNFDCSYCYESRGGRQLDFQAFVRAVDLLHPLLAPGCVVNFFGGEPLIAFDLMERAVEHLEKRSPRGADGVRYSVTTNGSLLNERILGFLEAHDFSIALSFDGLAQDITRQAGTFAFLEALIPAILARPRLSLETNSVFSAATVGYLAGSVETLVRLGVPKLDVNFAHTPAWTPADLSLLEAEIGRVGEFFLSHYDSPEGVPWTDFRRAPDRAIRRCTAGEDRMALSAQGELWGCAVFPHCRIGASGTPPAEYCFGDIEVFAADPQRLYRDRMDLYAGLRMDRFSTPDRACEMCDEIERCWLCPVAAGLTSGRIGRIAAVSCDRARLLRKGIRRFLEAFDGRAGSGPETPPG